MIFEKTTVQIPEDWQPIDTKQYTADETKHICQEYEIDSAIGFCEWILQNGKHAQSFDEGNRHNYIYNLSCLLNEYGISETDATYYINSTYPHFRENPSNAIKSAYKKTNKHGTREFKPFEKTDQKQESKKASQPETETPEPVEEVTGEHLLKMGIVKVPTLIDPIFQKIGLAAIAGSSDTGKSSFLRQLAIAICTGEKSFLGFPIDAQHQSAIYVSTEDDETAIAYLLNKQNKGKGYLNSAYKNLRYIFDTTNLLEQLDKRLTQRKADLVVIDAFTDLYSRSMNQSNEVRTFLNDYSQLAQKHKCLIVFLHHTGKRTDELAPSKHNLLGSQAFEAKMRLVIELRTDHNDSDIRHLCIVKGNYLPSELKQESYVLQFDENMLFHSTGERVSFESLAKTTDDKADKLQQAKELRDQGHTVQSIADELGVQKGTVSKWLKKMRVSSDVSESFRGNTEETE